VLRSHLINIRHARENGVEQGFSPALRQDKWRASAPEVLTSAAKAAFPTMQHTAGLKACSTLSTLNSSNTTIYEMASTYLLGHLDGLRLRCAPKHTRCTALVGVQRPIRSSLNSKTKAAVLTGKTSDHNP
jgi:hypothetical protein